MKLLFFFDSHLDSQGPISRIDNFEETCFSKFSEIKDIAKKNNCSYVLCSGDLLNRKGPKVSHRLIARAADFFRNLGVPFLTISGNHDQVGGDPTTIMDQPLGVLSRAANFKILGKDSVEQLDEEVFLTATPYHAAIDTVLEDYLPKRPAKAKVHLHLTHGSLTNIKPIWTPYTLYSDLKECKADFLLNGHLHDMHKTETINNTTIINPGSLTRGSLIESNINRQVSIVILDTDKRKVEIVPLKSALPASQIFDLEKHAQLEKAEQEIERLGELIKKESGNIELNGIESIRQIVKELKSIDDKTKDCIQKLLDRAEENV